MYWFWLLPAEGAKVKQLFSSKFVLNVTLDAVQTAVDFVLCPICDKRFEGCRGKKKQVEDDPLHTIDGW